MGHLFSIAICVRNYQRVAAGAVAVSKVVRLLQQPWQYQLWPCAPGPEIWNHWGIPTWIWCPVQDDLRLWIWKISENRHKDHQHPTWNDLVNLFFWSLLVWSSALHQDSTTTRLVRTWRGLPQRLHGEDGAGRSWKRGSQPGLGWGTGAVFDQKNHGEFDPKSPKKIHVLPNMFFFANKIWLWYNMI